MFIRKFRYLCQEAFRTLRRHKGVATLSVVIMSLSLLMLAVFLLATDNLLRIVGHARDEMKVYVYLEDWVDDSGVRRMHKELLAMKETDTVVFISKDQALLDFRDQLGEDADLLRELAQNPLPNSFWVGLKPEFRDKSSMAYFAGRAGQMTGVEEVRYGEEFIDKFASVIRGVYYVDVVVGFIVILSAIFIISNAVRLTMISRRKNIEILKLVGATNRFITMPFIIEGAFQGGLAAMFSLLLLVAVTAVSQRWIPDLDFFSGEKALLYALTCIAIGAIGSFTALRRYLRLT